MKKCFAQQIAVGSVAQVGDLAPGPFVGQKSENVQRNRYRDFSYGRRFQAVLDVGIDESGCSHDSFESVVFLTRKLFLSRARVNNFLIGNKQFGNLSFVSKSTFQTHMRVTFTPTIYGHPYVHTSVMEKSSNNLHSKHWRGPQGFRAVRHATRRQQKSRAVMHHASMRDAARNDLIGNPNRTTTDEKLFRYQTFERTISTAQRSRTTEIPVSVTHENVASIEARMVFDERRISCELSFRQEIR
jgi:hypothetical protein